TNMVAHLVIGHVWSDRRHHPGEIGAELWQPPLEFGVVEAAEREEDVGEVDAGRADCNLDLSRSRWNSVECNKFHRLEITGRADLQAHPVALWINHRSTSFVGVQWSRGQSGHIPRAVAPGGLVLVRAAQQ